jgi:glutathione synthase/RimK-type ligase-like ATP-grasp enzyme
VKIVPYKIGSKSAAKLAEKIGMLIGEKVWRGNPDPQQLNVNWGNGHLDNGGYRWLNKPDAVRNSIDKLSTFSKVKDYVQTVPYTARKEVAEAWNREESTVFARGREGFEGRGIHIIFPGQEIPGAALYTKWLADQREYRVYVFDGEVLHKQERRRLNGHQPALIWSTENGYILCNRNVNPPRELDGMAITVLDRLGLDFGAVDFLVRGNDIHFLETNTAFTLINPVGDIYAEHLTKI